MSYQMFAELDYDAMTVPCETYGEAVEEAMDAVRRLGAWEVNISRTDERGRPTQHIATYYTDIDAWSHNYSGV